MVSYEPEKGWTDFFEGERIDEFVLNPSGLTLAVGLTGVDGNTVKNAYLMNRYGIQINKTSRNSVLFMTNIGTTRSSVAYLIDVLARIAKELETGSRGNYEPGGAGGPGAPRPRPCHDLPELPDFSRFHDRFRPDPGQAGTPAGSDRDLVPVTLPPNTYPGQSDSVETVAATALLLGTAALPDSTVEAVLAEVYGGIDCVAAGSTAGALISKTTARIGLTLPLHPAAERFLLRDAPSQ